MDGNGRICRGLSELDRLVLRRNSEKVGGGNSNLVGDSVIKLANIYNISLLYDNVFMFTQEDSTVIFFLFLEMTTFSLSPVTSEAPEGTVSMA